MRLHITRIACIFIFMLGIFAVPVPGVAHPGNTAADGCHYCRTNCAKWGEVEGERHCHGGSSSSSSAATYTAPTPAPAPKTYNIDGKTYYSESDYNAAIEDKFQTEHKASIRTIYTQVYATDIPEDKLVELAAFSRDSKKIEELLRQEKDTADKAAQEKQEAEAQAAAAAVAEQEAQAAQAKAAEVVPVVETKVDESKQEVVASEANVISDPKQNDSDDGMRDALGLLAIGGILAFAYTENKKRSK